VIEKAENVPAEIMSAVSECGKLQLGNFVQRRDFFILTAFIRS
jgi:hypothetical protein